ncbi:unnamed protein product, partial [Ascophyllum nodosum]
GIGRGGHQVQLPPRQLRGLVESGHFGCCGVLQEQSDGRADEAGSVCRCLQPLRHQQRHAERTPEAGGGPPPYIRAHQTKRHEHDPTRRGTSQFKMMYRLLALKKPISEYF